MSTKMLCLCLLLPILAVIGAEPNMSSTELRCDKRLDVISYSGWPILARFSLELTDNAALINIGFDHTDGVDYTRAVLHDRRKKTYLYELFPHYNVSNGPYNTRKLSEIPGLSVKDIKFGSKFIVILTEDGAVWTVGEIHYGQLPGVTFTKVPDVPVIKALAVGDYHCIALAADGVLFSWGRDPDKIGVLGRTNGDSTPTSFNLGSGESLPTSICCTWAACMALTEDKRVFTWGHGSQSGRSGNPEPGEVLDIPTIDKVTCGIEHMLALSSSGRLYGWGKNGHGQLLSADKEVKHPIELELDLGGSVVKDVVAGWKITIIRTNTDEVYYFGFYDGQGNNATQLKDGFYPRDLMAKSDVGQISYGAVSLGCE